MNIPLILSSKYPEALWELNGEEYSGLTWKSDTPKPTEEHLASLWPEVQYDIEKLKVERVRRDLYQEFSDPIFFSYQRGEATKEEWEAAVQDIKTSNPYPELLN